MLKRFPIHLIPHGIDIEAFQPLDSEKCRSLLGLPSSNKVLMFAALSMNQFNKGGDLLLKAIEILPERLKAETTLLLLGQGGGAIARAVGLRVLDLGQITNDRLKAIAYSAADIFVSPTRAEAFGLVCLESVACGTPVVAFSVGGVPDVVRHGVTGYLAEPENSTDLCNGIIELLEDEQKRSYMSQKGSAIAQKEYELGLQVQRHIELYQQVLGV
jgi:glycosyltransferase involved in cell wall biosynthesis